MEKKFKFPNPGRPGTGYDDGWCGPTAVAVALCHLAAGRTQEETFVVAEHHTVGHKCFEIVRVFVGKIRGEPRYRYSDGGPEASLSGGPGSPEEICRAVAHLTAMLSKREATIYRKG